MEAFSPQSAQDRIPGQDITPTAVCINNQLRLPVCMLSCFSHVQVFATLWIVARRAPLSKAFTPAKNTGMGCHAFLQGTFLIQGSNPRLISPALAGGFFTTSTTWEAPSEGCCCC